jgi:hypothetical protein
VKIIIYNGNQPPGFKTGCTTGITTSGENLIGLRETRFEVDGSLFTYNQLGTYKNDLVKRVSLVLDPLATPVVQKVNLFSMTVNTKTFFPNVIPAPTRTCFLPQGATFRITKVENPAFLRIIDDVGVRACTYEGTLFTSTLVQPNDSLIGTYVVTLMIDGMPVQSPMTFIVRATP